MADRDDPISPSLKGGRNSESAHAPAARAQPDPACTASPASGPQPRPRGLTRQRPRPRTNSIGAKLPGSHGRARTSPRIPRVTLPLAESSGVVHRPKISDAPRLLERIAVQSIDVVWGERGQQSAAATIRAIESQTGNRRNRHCWTDRAANFRTDKAASTPELPVCAVSALSPRATRSHCAA